MNYTLRYVRRYIRREPIHNDIHSLCFQVVTHYEDLLSQATGIEALESKELNYILYDESLPYMEYINNKQRVGACNSHTPNRRAISIIDFH